MRHPAGNPVSLTDIWNWEHLWVLALKRTLSSTTLKYSSLSSVFIKFSGSVRVQIWSLNSHYSNCIVTNVDMWHQKLRKKNGEKGGSLNSHNSGVTHKLKKTEMSKQITPHLIFIKE